jgi:transposase
MIPVPMGTQIWVACGATDMRRGFDGLAMMVQEVIKKDPYLCGGREYVAAQSHNVHYGGDEGPLPPHNIQIRSSS